MACSNFKIAAARVISGSGLLPWAPAAGIRYSSIITDTYRPKYGYYHADSPFKAHDLHTHGLVEVGPAALLIDDKEAKISDKSLKYPVSQILAYVAHLFKTFSATETTNFGSLHSHLKAIAASKRIKGGPHQV